MDIETGRFARIGAFAGSDPIQVAWLEDGRTMAVKHLAVFSYTDKNDVYMIRNFGRLLRR